MKEGGWSAIALRPEVEGEDYLAVPPRRFDHPRICERFRAEHGNETPVPVGAPSAGAGQRPAQPRHIGRLAKSGIDPEGHLRKAIDESGQYGELGPPLHDPIEIGDIDGLESGQCEETGQDSERLRTRRERRLDRPVAGPVAALPAHHETAHQVENWDHLDPLPTHCLGHCTPPIDPSGIFTPIERNAMNRDRDVALNLCLAA